MRRPFVASAYPTNGRDSHSRLRGCRPTAMPTAATVTFRGSSGVPTHPRGCKPSQLAGPARRLASHPRALPHPRVRGIHIQVIRIKGQNSTKVHQRVRDAPAAVAACLSSVSTNHTHHALSTARVSTMQVRGAPLSDAARFSTARRSRLRDRFLAPGAREARLHRYKCVK